VAIVPQQDDQIGHTHKEHHCVKDVFELEVLHHTFVTTSVHSLVELLEDKHPLQVHNQDEPVAGPIELFAHDCIGFNLWVLVDSWIDATCHSKLFSFLQSNRQSVNHLLRICLHKERFSHMACHVDLDKDCKGGNTNSLHKVPALGSISPYLELEPVTPHRLE
jgi:hypothetical protein